MRTEVQDCKFRLPAVFGSLKWNLGALSTKCPVLDRERSFKFRIHVFLFVRAYYVSTSFIHQQPPVMSIVTIDVLQHKPSGTATYQALWHAKLLLRSGMRAGPRSGVDHLGDQLSSTRSTSEILVSYLGSANQMGGFTTTQHLSRWQLRPSLLYQIIADPLVADSRNISGVKANITKHLWWYWWVL